MIGTIYALADPDTDNIRYCGKTVRAINHRMNAHRKDARDGIKRHLYNWLRPIYASNREPKLIQCEVVDLEDCSKDEIQRRMDEAETRWIGQLKALGFRLTNATNGGDGTSGTKLSPERKAFLLSLSKGIPKTPQTRQKISETKKRLNKLYPERVLSGERSPLWGIKQPAEQIANRVEMLRRIWSAKTPEELSEHGSRHLGEKNNKTKLTNEVVLEIYRDTRSFSVLCKEHELTKTAISCIKNGITWRHVTGHVDPRPKREKITADQALLIYNDKRSERKIAAALGITRAIVTGIKSGRTWKQVTSHNIVRD